ncbi:hypothetical protein [Variovorax soli]|uniref:Uncharacterized protein YjiS (DUF1127 family) n=1 Tax=Variovorax soli TaxID=376815 RepID=A0ABU1N7H4_9BURK|nr:hypothetical protein [Variovorax soli]MDR6534396.1 uncharacterized protein YjiS (DUF1127 family) [Variovorax soli]
MALKMHLPTFGPLRTMGDWLARATASRRARHRAGALKTMSEYELRDLGIGRSEVPALMRGTADRRQGHAGGTGS